MTKKTKTFTLKIVSMPSLREQRVQVCHVANDDSNADVRAYSATPGAISSLRCSSVLCNSKYRRQQLPATIHRLLQKWQQSNIQRSN